MRRALDDVGGRDTGSVHQDGNPQYGISVRVDQWAARREGSATFVRFRSFPRFKHLGVLYQRPEVMTLRRIGDPLVCY
jgi:hypothetical protein